MMNKKIGMIMLLINMAVLTAGCTSDTQQAETTAEEAAEAVSEQVAYIDDSDLRESITGILTNKDFYPDITAIDCNDTYTEFTITLEGDTMNMYESMLVMSFYTFGNEKQVQLGTAEEDALTVVRYVNGATGEIISETDSSSMVTE